MPPHRSESGLPITLGNMRSLGGRVLALTCQTCRHEIRLDVDAYPDHVEVPSFGPQMVCAQCGSTGADVRPLWLHQPGRAAETTQTEVEPQLNVDQIRALRTLSGAEPRGVTGALLIMHGLSPHLLFGMERDGLVSAEVEMTGAGRRSVEVRKFRSTEAGRRVLGK